MFYGGSVSPPQEPPKKTFMIPRRESEKKMGDRASASTMPGVRESLLMWPMLDRSNYMEWAMPLYYIIRYIDAFFLVNNSHKITIILSVN
jgi:hypothetical protein